MRVYTFCSVHRTYRATNRLEAIVGWLDSHWITTTRDLMGGLSIPKLAGALELPEEDVQFVEQIAQVRLVSTWRREDKTCPDRC